MFRVDGVELVLDFGCSFVHPLLDTFIEFFLTKFRVWTLVPTIFCYIEFLQKIVKLVQNINFHQILLI